MLIKTEHPGFVRDTESKAVINTDVEAYKNYKLLRDEKLKVRQLSNEVESIKQDVQEIKHLLKMLVKQG